MTDFYNGAHSHRRRRGSQGSNPSKGSRPYFIPTSSKPKSVDGSNCPNRADWEQQQRPPPPPPSSAPPLSSGARDNNVDKMAATTTVSQQNILTKAASEPCDGGRGGQQQSQHFVEDKERKHSTKSGVVQPIGTMLYTVDKNDTLTSIAARFETTPSELVKINRLVSRVIFPGLVLFVPEHRASTETSSSSVVPGSPPDSSSKDLPPKGTPTDVAGGNSAATHGSPKPGHAERVRTPPPPFHTSPSLSSSSDPSAAEQKADNIRTQKFLKINVKHITDGQGVVSGVLLVTPNAVMFDPSVVDILVMEHGADRYGVIAPMDYVANAALYSDIAHMRVKHVPQSSLPQPEIYHTKSCPLYKGESSAAAVTTTTTDGGGQPCSRSESQQAVKGSVSDKAELSDDDDDDGGGEEKEDEEEEEEGLGGSSVCSCQTKGSEEEAQSPDDTSEVFVAEELPSRTGSAQRDDSEIAQSDAGGDQPTNGKVLATEEEEEDCRPSQQQQQTLTVDEGTAALATARKHSIPEAQAASSDKLRLKMLKRLSYPLWGSDALYDDSKTEEATPPPTAEVPKSSPVPIEPSGGQQQAAATTLSRLLTSASPKNLVDFSTGIFLKSADCVGKVADVSQLGPRLSQSWIAPPSPSLDGWVESTKNLLLTGGRRASDGGGQEGVAVCEARNYNVAAMLPGGDDDDDAASSSSKRGGSRTGSREETRIEFKNEVSGKIELFQTLDKLIPRPARSCDDPPLYLCLRMGRPLHKRVASTTPIMSYGQHKMKSEYWFSIPKDRVDDLYLFFQQWAPGVYGELNEADVRERGFRLIEPDDDEEEEQDQPDDHHHHRTKKTKKQKKSSGGSGEDEQVVAAAATSLDDDDGGTPKKRGGDADTELHSWEKIKAPYQKLFGRLRRETQSSDSEVVSVLDIPEHEYVHQMSLDLESLLPELIGQTEVLSEDHRRSLSKILPARAQGYSWSLIFNASQHGFSLQSMYRRMAKFETPVLLVIQDTNNNVFGAMTSCTFKVSDHFYGTGESFLYTFHPDFKVFGWTGENVFFIKGNVESLAIGAGDGVFGLWLDGDLYHGRSHCCKTYNNDVLTEGEDFCVKMLEAWGFMEFSAVDSVC